MIGFGEYLKDYLEFNNISQTEFSIRLGISQKHINEILNGKKNITTEMAANIERLTGINSSFILKIENSKKITDEILKEYGNENNIRKTIIKEYCVNEIKKNNWIIFKDEKNYLQICLDILDFLKVKDFKAAENLQEKVLFKKKNESDLKKIALWIAHCDEIVKNQKLNEYYNYNFNFLIKDLKENAYKNKLEIKEIQKILNKYGIYFVCEKALVGSKIRGCFKVKGKHPTIYVTDNYAGKDSFFFELFHELGHCKSDYNEGQNKTIIDGNTEKEEKSDKFALNTMIDPDIWKKIEYTNFVEIELLKISKEYEIPMSFIVGRLANLKRIKYQEKLYQKYYK